MKYIWIFELISLMVFSVDASEFRIQNSEFRLPVEVKVIESNSHKSLIKITLQGIDEQLKLGNELPVISRMVAVPKGSDVKVKIITSDLSEVGVGGSRSDGILSEEGVPANEIVSIGAQGIMRDYQVVQLLVHPIRYNSVYKEIIVELEYSGGQGWDLPSFAFEPIYKSLMVNYSNINVGAYCNTPLPPGGYLIIVPDDFYDGILPLAEWKRLKGWKTTVSKLSVVGSTPSQIKSYIQNAYNTWDPPPEYVLLVGDVNKLPAFTNLPECPSVTDHPYSLVDGADYFSDILVGRISVASLPELQVVVNKILGYEKTPYLGETDWYKKALMVGGNYPAGVTTAVPTKKWVRDLFFANGYTQVDTVFYPPTADGSVPISQSVNAGVSFVNYRGWSDSGEWHKPQFDVSDIQALSNGWKLPVVTAISCGTGNFNAPVCLGEAWLRAGTISQPKGGIASYGPSILSTKTKYNNCIDYGIYWGIFKENLSSLGQACYRGKLELCNNFPQDTTIKNYFYYYNLLGDPELNIWTDVPESLQVEHLDSIEVGTNFFAVTVSAGLNPLEGALVALFKEGEVETTGFTDANGLLSLPIEVATPGAMFVTVTANNYIPYLDSALIILSNVYVGFENYTIDDDNSGASQGNGDGEINPGEIIEMAVGLKNNGTTDTAYNVEATLVSSDTFVSVIDSIKGFGNLPPGSIVNGSPYVFEVTTSCTNNYTIRFQLNITSGAGNWVSGIALPVYAPAIRYVSCQVIDGGNAYLDPGEVADLEVCLWNSGKLGITNVRSILRADIQAVAIIDSEGVFGDIPIGDSATNSGDKFRVKVDSEVAVARSVCFTLSITGDVGYSELAHFSIIIGEIDSTAPLGPDKYGYYVYDDTDTGYNEVPVYGWIEIDPEHGGQGQLIPLGKDEIKVLPLPFVFRFYGKDYNRISVCSNGYISMDSIWLAEPYNWHIPSSMGSPTLIAPFWDYLDPTAMDSGNVVYYYDSGAHRFIVEWSRIYNIHETHLNPTPSAKQTFELILLDPGYYPTLTGDGEMVFQYHTVVNDDTCHNYCTVGIEDETHMDGLEYTFANIYPAAAAILCNGRAIKFTTDPPDTFGAVEEKVKSKEQRAKLEVHPNPFSRSTVIEFSNVGVQYIEPLQIYDIAGRIIRTLPIPNPQSLTTEVVWDGRDNEGKIVNSGIYFCELTVTGKASCLTKIKKMVFISKIP